MTALKYSYLTPAYPHCISNIIHKFCRHEKTLSYLFIELNAACLLPPCPSWASTYSSTTIGQSKQSAQRVSLAWAWGLGKLGAGRLVLGGGRRGSGLNQHVVAEWKVQQSRLANIWPQVQARKAAVLQPQLRKVQQGCCMWQSRMWGALPKLQP